MDESTITTKAKRGETVHVGELPTCDLCSEAPAEYDSKIVGRTAWAYLCHRCFISVGTGRLGTGSAQRLLPTRWVRYVEACQAETLIPHDVHMWIVHGEPNGPIG